MPGAECTALTRLLYGLNSVPRGLAPDDPRLPGVTLGPAPLRLNSEPVPGIILATTEADHAPRWDAMVAWLQSQCGDYAVRQCQFIADYMAWVAAAPVAVVDEFDGLYTRHDRAWSALRPLPRAWVSAGNAMVKLDIAFWDGATLYAVAFGPPPVGFTVLDPDVAALPATFADFWRGETLPRSPFRRPMPRLVPPRQ